MINNKDFSHNILSESEAQKYYEIQNVFFDSYNRVKDSVSVEDWLKNEIKIRFPLHSSEEQDDIFYEIIDTIKTNDKYKASLDESINEGESKEQWFSNCILQHTSHMSSHESLKYAQGLDEAVNNANQSMLDSILRKDGGVSNNPNLDGFIAEAHHANTFNLKAKAAGSDLQAVVLRPKPGQTYGANSVDIVIKDSTGKIIKRYQSKYGATAKDTIDLLKEGNYNNQRILVPADQVNEVQKAFPNKTVTSTVSEGNISSEPLTKAEAKSKQDKVQNGSLLDYSWDDFSTKDIVKGVSKEIGKSCLMGAAVGAGVTILTDVVKKEKIDPKEVAKVSIETGADFGVKAVVAFALKYASEKEIIKALPKGTNASVFANIAFVSVENAKVLYKIGSGKLTPREGVKKMEETSLSCVIGIAASSKGKIVGGKIGAKVGGIIGTSLGPIGTFVGGFIGGAIGYIGGAAVGKTIVTGIHNLESKEAYEAIMNSSGSVRELTLGLDMYYGYIVHNLNECNKNIRKNEDKQDEIQNAFDLFNEMKGE